MIFCEYRFESRKTRALIGWEENDIFEGKTWMYITAVICGEGTLERIPSTDLRTLL